MAKISKLIKKYGTGEEMSVEEYQNRKDKGPCGKICFDKKGAQTKKNWLERRGNEKLLRIYPCSDCNGAWHLTKRLNYNQKYGKR